MFKKIKEIFCGMKFLERFIPQVMHEISTMGSLPFLFFFSVLLIVLEQYTQGYALLISLFVLFILVIPFRLLLFRERPKKVSYDNWILKIDASSFPSMHAARVGVLVVLFDFSILFIFLALLVGLSRYYLQKHYVSDLVVGYAFGILIGLSVNTFF